MSKRWIKAASTSQTIDIFVLDSSSTVGAGLTGLVFNTAGLTCYYRKGALGTPTAITLATLATVGTAWASGGFIAVDAAGMPGVYRLDIPNVVIDTAGMVTMYLRGATNMAPVVLELEIVAVDIYDTIRLGLTALPNTAVTTNGSLITSGTGTAQLSVASGLVTLAGVTHTGAVIPTVSTVSNRVSANTDQWNGVAVTGMPMPTYTQPAGFLSATFPGGTIANTTNITAGTITTATGVTNAVTVGTLNNSVITAASIATDAITAAKFADDALVIQSAAALGNKIRFASDAITSTVIATDAITNAELAATAVQEIWDYNISAYVTAGLAGTYLKNAGAAGNPWLTDIGNAVTYPVASTAGGYLRDNLSKTGTIENGVLNLPLAVWTSIYTSDSTTYGQFSGYSMIVITQSMCH